MTVVRREPRLPIAERQLQLLAFRASRLLFLVGRSGKTRVQMRAVLS